jgi:hypothetical protein
MSPGRVKLKFVFAASPRANNGIRIVYPSGAMLIVNDCIREKTS